MSSKPHVFLLLLLSLALAACPKKPVTTDAGTPVTDAGEVDAGLPDAGADDAGLDGGADAGPPELKILQVLPPRGSSAGGTTVLLTGSGFLHDFAASGNAALKLTTLKVGGNAVIDAQIIDDGTLELRTPPGVTGSASISIQNPNGHVACNGCFTYFDDLVVTALAPKSGPLEGGNEVVLTGQGFTADAEVLFGGQSSPQVTYVSAKQLKVLVPRGAQTADPVDVVVYNKNGSNTQRRAYQYVAPTRISQVTPLAGPLAGGTSVTVTGQGFTGATAVSFGTLAAASFTVDADGQVTAVTPAGTALGAVDVTVTAPQGTAVAKGAFSYVDAAGSYAVYAVYPHVVSAGQTVTVVGQGLDAVGLSVSVGGVAATVGAQTFSTAVVTIPLRGSAPRRADVAVTTGSTLTLTQGVTWRLSASALAPNIGPAAGSTSVTLTGAALPTGLSVRLGALPATGVTVASEVSGTFTTPKGSGGAATDLWLQETADPENEATLTGAFTFEEPLSVGRVQPERGAIAGNTLVTVSGAGFGDGTTVSFGASKAKDVKVQDSHTLTCRTPKGDLGTVDVTVTRDAQRDTLPGGYSYFDPRSISGGLSGGALVGTLNVTVLDSTYSNYGAPISRATVVLGLDPATPFQGLTDGRGQITFSDPSLVKAQTVTVFKEGYESATVTQVASENVTVFLSYTGGGDGSPTNTGTSTPASSIQGRVTGFKAPRPLTTGESLEARVFVAQTSLYAGPPFSGAPYKAPDTWQVTQEGGSYLVYTGAGLRAVYAILGIANATTQAFTPFAMGVKRAITTSPENPAIGEDIVIDMLLDQSVVVTIDSPLSYLPTDGGLTEEPATNSLYAWLDLGAEGFIPNPDNFGSGKGSATTNVSTGGVQTMTHFPALDGSNFIFLAEATANLTYPASDYYRRQAGPLSNGVTIGPMLPAPKLNPVDLATFTISWTVDPGPQPDLVNVQLIKPTLLGSVTLWNMVLPGTDTQVVLPSAAVTNLRTVEAGNPMYLVINSSRSSKFSYSQWTYDQLGGASWSAFTTTISDVFTP
jgi:hypothetical protein